MTGKNPKRAVTGPSRDPRAFAGPERMGGITLIEVLVALGMLAILLGFAATPLERMSARVDVDMARENVTHVLEAARRASIRANAPVRVLISDQAPAGRIEAAFARQRGNLAYFQLPHYSLPEHVTVSLSEGMSQLVFQPIGRVNTTGVITLSSRYNPDYAIRIEIVNLAGTLRVGDGLMQRLDRLDSE